MDFANILAWLLQTVTIELLFHLVGFGCYCVLICFDMKRGLWSFLWRVQSLSPASCLRIIRHLHPIRSFDRGEKVSFVSLSLVRLSKVR